MRKLFLHMSIKLVLVLYGELCSKGFYSIIFPFLSMGSHVCFIPFPNSIVCINVGRFFFQYLRRRWRNFFLPFYGFSCVLHFLTKRDRSYWCWKIFFQYLRRRWRKRLYFILSYLFVYFSLDVYLFVGLSLSVVISIRKRSKDQVQLQISSEQISIYFYHLLYWM